MRVIDEHVPGAHENPRATTAEHQKVDSSVSDALNACVVHIPKSLTEAMMHLIRQSRSLMRLQEVRYRHLGETSTDGYRGAISPHSGVTVPVAALFQHVAQRELRRKCAAAILYKHQPGACPCSDRMPPNLIAGDP